MGSLNSEIDRLQQHFKTHSKIREYQAHSAKVHSVGWSCDGRRLASGSFDKTVSIFTLDRERLVSLCPLSLNLHQYLSFLLKVMVRPCVPCIDLNH